MSGEEDAGRILDFWEVIDRVDPLPDPWMQTAMICEQIERGNAIELAKTGSDVEITDYKAFMPPRWVAPPTPVKQAQSREDQCKALDRGINGR